MNLQETDLPSQGSIVVGICWRRPNYQSAAAWLSDARIAIRDGRQPWEPVTRDELLLAAKHFPEHIRRWLPTPDMLLQLGLPETFGRPVPPFSKAWRETFFETLRVDRAFCLGIKRLLENAQ